MPGQVRPNRAPTTERLRGRVSAGGASAFQVRPFEKRPGTFAVRAGYRTGSRIAQRSLAGWQAAVGGGHVRRGTRPPRTGSVHGGSRRLGRSARRRERGRRTDRRGRQHRQTGGTRHGTSEVARGLQAGKQAGTRRWPAARKSTPVRETSRQRLGQSRLVRRGAAGYRTGDQRAVTSTTPVRETSRQSLGRPRPGPSLRSWLSDGRAVCGNDGRAGSYERSAARKHARRPSERPTAACRYGRGKRDAFRWRPWCGRPAARDCSSVYSLESPERSRRFSEEHARRAAIPSRDRSSARASVSGASVRGRRARPPRAAADRRPDGGRAGRR